MHISNMLFIYMFEKISDNYDPILHDYLYISSFP